MSPNVPPRTAIAPQDIADNVFKLIGEDWMLITAGSLDSFNTMTASWGGLGVLWNRPVAFAFVRPVRYTYEFTEREDRFTLTFFPEEYRAALTLCGTKSGRDGDKVAEAGLTPLASPEGSVYFAEARLVLECRKLYTHDIDPAHLLEAGLDASIYPAKDYHRLYIAEIVAAWTQ